MFIRVQYYVKGLQTADLDLSTRSVVTLVPDVHFDGRGGTDEFAAIMTLTNGREFRLTGQSVDRLKKCFRYA